MIRDRNIYGIPNEPAVDDCTDQLPLFSQVGRGIKGDSSYVGIQSDSDNATYLEGKVYDEATKTWSTEWISENINGGHLSYSYNFLRDSSPQGFTITFTYTRPGRTEWEWTTPIIPFIADTEEWINEYYAESLSKILSIPKQNIIWLLENKEGDEVDENGEEGVHGTGKDLLDYIDDKLTELSDDLEDFKTTINRKYDQLEIEVEGLEIDFADFKTTTNNKYDQLEIKVENLGIDLEDFETTTKRKYDQLEIEVGGLGNDLEDEQQARLDGDAALQKQIDELDFDNDTIIQEYVINHFEQLIVDNMWMLSGEDTDNELNLWWRICYSPLINLSMIKVTKFTDDTVMEVGKLYTLTDTINLSNIPVLPSYGDITFPFAYCQYWDNDANVLVPATVYLLFGIVNEVENRAGLRLRCYPNDMSRSYPEGATTGTIHINNSVMYFNNYAEDDSSNGLVVPAFLKNVVSMLDEDQKEDK